jgi:hypothetical protein
MTFSDYLLDIALIAVVFRQVREARFSPKMMLLPLVIAGVVASQYLHGIPTAGNDLVLVIALAAVGLAFGAVSGMTTRVRMGADGYPLVKAGWVAAGTWVLSMGFRFGFSLWVSHGGAPDLIRFSAQHGITSGDAWTAALILMAIGEVAVRTGLIWLRATRIQQSAEEPKTLTVV